MSRLKKTVAHILVCNHKHCLKRGARDSIKELRNALREHDLRRYVMVSTIECLDQCSHAPVMCVYPDGVWYKEVDPATARAVVEEHLVRNRIIIRHFLHDIKEAGDNHPLSNDFDSAGTPQAKGVEQDENVE